MGALRKVQSSVARSASGYTRGKIGFTLVTLAFVTGMALASLGLLYTDIMNTRRSVELLALSQLSVGSSLVGIALGILLSGVSIAASLLEITDREEAALMDVLAGISFLADTLLDTYAITKGLSLGWKYNLYGFGVALIVYGIFSEVLFAILVPTSIQLWYENGGLVVDFLSNLFKQPVQASNTVRRTGTQGRSLAAGSDD